MSDRGEKIVRLAREMLQDSHLDELTVAADLAPAEKRKKSMTVRTACLAALLGAATSAGATHVLHEMSRPVNRYERVEIEALVFYAAQQLGTTEASVRMELSQQGAPSEPTDFTVSDYYRIREYLWSRLKR